MAKHRYTDQEIQQWRKDNHKMMYANKDDSRIWVPRASGFGIPTINWANPIGWLIILGFVALILILRFVVFGQFLANLRLRG